MSRPSSNFYRRYYQALYRFFAMDRHTRLLAIDFKKPWWQLLFKQKQALGTVLVIESICDAFLAAPALILGLSLEHNRFDYFLYFIAVWFIVLVIEYGSDFCVSVSHIQCVQSIYYQAQQHILTIDPIHHASSEKGKITAKIYRAADAYQEVLRLVTYDLLPVAVGAITVISSFLAIDLKLGILALSLLVLLCVLFSALYIVTAKTTMPMRIKTDDEAKNLGTESLAQIELIRTTFTSDHIDDRLKSVNQRRLAHESTAWRAYFVVGTVAKMAYLVVFAVHGMYIISLVHTGTISHLLGASLLITFFTGTYQLLGIGRFLFDIKTNVDRVKDLFAFLNLYGQQTFPVLEPIKHQTSDTRQATSIEAKKIKFRYNAYTSIFDGHNVLLEVPCQQTNKLYGIIGYSGQGKSTLLSILGGQLKPQQGTVKINGINIYQTNDATRRHLLALQKQVSSSLWGTARYNLTFGLNAHEPLYTDDELIALLTQVGLWGIFSRKRGLETVISEGGLTLSTGQRQRLNFASLYLRAQHYKPALILIDEPTSSQDGASEQTITEMIARLAKESVVFVVAHRIKTLEKTAGILDLSTALQTPHLQFCDHATLLAQSTYYRQLVAGTALIESTPHHEPIHASKNQHIAL